MRPPRVIVGARTISKRTSASCPRVPLARYNVKSRCHFGKTSTRMTQLRDIRDVVAVVNVRESGPLVASPTSSEEGLLFRVHPSIHWFLSEGSEPTEPMPPRALPYLVPYSVRHGTLHELLLRRARETRPMIPLVSSPGPWRLSFFRTTRQPISKHGRFAATPARD